MAKRKISAEDRQHILRTLTQVGARMEDASTDMLLAGRLDDHELRELVVRVQKECHKLSRMMDLEAAKLRN